MALSYDVASFRLSPGEMFQVKSPVGSNEYWRLHASTPTEGSLTLQRGSGKVYEREDWLSREVDEVVRRAWT